MQDLIAAWEQFRGVLKLYGKALSTLNPSCPTDTIRDVERDLSFEIPEPLAAILKVNNGQTLDSTGIFKSTSGWNRYCRHTFLDAKSVGVAYKSFVESEDLLAELGDQEIPFAIAGTLDYFKEMFSIHRQTHRVSLVWTEVHDPWMPVGWQLTRFPRGENLAEFFRRQVTLY
jgi:hypothetical protein